MKISAIRSSLDERMKDCALTVLLCGVGGQGTLLAADLLAKTAAAAGLCAKVSEIHGMAQRGGSVTTVVRFGRVVNAMVCDPGCADCVLSFESTEALRCAPFKRDGGIILTSDETIKPLSVLTGQAMMPHNVNERLHAMDACIVPAARLAQEAGTIKCSNVVLLGALSNVLPFDKQNWQERDPRQSSTKNH
jgi:indolepyruvate ferredoxin oxidoreductase beta subunit